MSIPLLNVESVSFSYGNDGYALKDVSLQIGSGDVCSVIGRNGSGKSTLVRIISGIYSGYKGNVIFAGKPVSETGRKELSRYVSYIPQENSFDEVNLTVSEFLSLGRYAHGDGLAVKAIKEEALNILGINELNGRKINLLSGGERQKVLLALSLVQLDLTNDMSGKLLIVDEPLTFLDVKYQFEIFCVLTKLNSEKGLTVLAVTHDLNIAIKYTNRTFLLEKGVLVKSGNTRDIITEESLEKYFMINSQIVNFENDLHINFIPNLNTGKNGVQ